jgi:hypothetical protein
VDVTVMQRQTDPASGEQQQQPSQSVRTCGQEFLVCIACAARVSLV